MSEEFRKSATAGSSFVKRVFTVLASLVVVTLPALIIRPQDVAERRLQVPKRDTTSLGSRIGATGYGVAANNAQALRARKERKDGNQTIGAGMIDAVAQNESTGAFLDLATANPYPFVDGANAAGMSTGISGVFSVSPIAERAQFSFARYAAGSLTDRALFSEYQLGGVSVNGPILSGRALARDRFGQPVGSLAQPNLLVAGRGFIPASVGASGSGTTEDAPVTQRSAATTTPAPAATPEQEESRELRREKLGLFDFEEQQFGVFTIFRTENGERVQIGTLRENTDAIETITLTGLTARSTWEAFVGELFLIAVEPALVGGANAEGFELRNLDPQSHLLLMRFREGDTIQSIGGIAALDFTIQSLPDLLLEEATTLRGIRGGRAVTVVISSLQR